MTRDDALDLSDLDWATLYQALTGPGTAQVDVSWLDGYLAGLSLQPQPLSGSAWLLTALGVTPQDPRIAPLCERRLQALRTALRCQSWWDPFIRAEFDDAGPTTAEQLSETLGPWVAGLDQALHDFALPQVEDDPAWMMVLARLYRHLPPSNDQDREVVTLLNKAHPLNSLEDAVDELTACVGELWDLVPPPQ